MTDALEHFTKGSIVALICVAAILKFILSKRDEKTGIKSTRFISKFLPKNFENFFKAPEFQKTIFRLFLEKTLKVTNFDPYLLGFRQGNRRKRA